MSESSSSPFLFVRPTQPIGRLDAYSGDHRSRVFERTSWEWLLERTVRRYAVLGAVGKKLQSLYLADRKAAYSLQTRTVPRTSDSVYGPHGSYVDIAELQLSDGTGSPDDPNLRSTKVSFAPAEIGGQAVDLAENEAHFLDPGEPYVGYVSEASLTETSFAHDGPRLPDEPPNWQVETSILNRPFEPVPVPAFRDVTLRRCADEPVTVDFPEWDPRAGEYVDRRRRAWPVRDPREWTSGGDRPALCPWEGAPGVEVPVLYGVPYYVERVSRVPVHSRLNLEPYAGPGRLFDRYAVTGRTLDEGGSHRLVGFAGPESFPPSESPASAFLGSVDRPVDRPSGNRLPDETYACRIPTWNGKPTFWAMHGFPRLDPLPPRSVFRRQLEMLCLAQPCVPPGTLRPAPSSESTGRPGRFRRPFPVACAAEPAEASRMLDLLTCTLIPVPAVYAEISASFSGSGETRMWSMDLDDREVFNSSRSSSSVSRVVSGPVVGDLGTLFGWCDPPWGNSSQFLLAGSSYSDTGTSSSEVWNYSSAGTSGLGHYTRTADGGSCDHAVAETLIPVRSGGVPFMRPSVRTAHTYVQSGRADMSFDYGYDAVREPLETEHLLLQPDVLAWVESAELLAYMDVTAHYESPYDGRVEYSHSLYANGLQDVQPVSHSTKSGTRVHRRKKTLTRIGSLDPATGALDLDGGLDLAGLAALAAPELPESGPDVYHSVSESSEKSTSGTVTHSYPRKPVVILNDAGLYLAVRWKFDTREPPEPSASGSGIAMKLALALARVAALSRRRDAVALSRYVLSDAVAGLSARTDGLAAALDGADAARAMLEALRSTLASLTAERRDLAIPDAETSPAEHLQAVARAAELDIAISDVSRRVSALESAATMTRPQAVAALDEARARIAAAQAKADEMEDALRAARELRDAARSAAQAVSGSVSQAEAALAALESAVDALEEAVDALEEDLAELDVAVESAALAVDAAESAVDAAVTVSPST